MLKVCRKIKKETTRAFPFEAENHKFHCSMFPHFFPEIKIHVNLSNPAWMPWSEAGGPVTLLTVIAGKPGKVLEKIWGLHSDTPNSRHHSYHPTFHGRFWLCWCRDFSMKQCLWAKKCLFVMNFRDWGLWWLWTKTGSFVPVGPGTNCKPWRFASNCESLLPQCVGRTGVHVVQKTCQGSFKRGQIYHP